MKETSPDSPFTDRLRSWAQSKVHGGNRSSARRPGSDHEPQLVLPISNNEKTISPDQSSVTKSASNHGSGNILSSVSRDALTGDEGKGTSSRLGSRSNSYQNAGSHNGLDGGSLSTPSPQTSRKGSQLGTDATSETTIEKKDQDQERPNRFKRFFITGKKVIMHSYLNLLLVFVPIGIAVELVPGMNPGVVFGMNAIAIIPLAGILAYATESVAHNMGDAIGALMNITFGNAVELIILYVYLLSLIPSFTSTWAVGFGWIIALVKNEILIVQAAILGSILSNLLLILGMSFLLGGLRYREQIYNSTVTQMSACLLSLSVISLVLPTAFHASFQDKELADAQSLIISRGTSIILLLVYGLYLLFQLKSHAYMYESTPQDVIDAESTPGPAVAWFDSSSSDDSSSSSSDSDSSGRSRETIQKRVKRMVRHGRRRKSSVASVDTVETGSLQTRPVIRADTSSTLEDGEHTQRGSPILPRTNSQPVIDDDSSDDDRHHRRRRYRKSKRSKRFRKQSKKTSHGSNSPIEQPLDEIPETAERAAGEPRRVDFAVSATADGPAASSGEGATSRRPFDALLALKPVAKSLTPTVFAQPPNTSEVAPVPTGPVPRVRYGIRRTNSLPGRLNDPQVRPPGAMFPSQISAQAMAVATGTVKTTALYENQLSRISAMVLLLLSTGLVAVCAEFMVGAIDGLLETSPINEVFIGLIILPIVGNAAEHVTAITVAMKNKMDLSIGVAVGSSIQVALFMSPLTVILGWCMNREMTLYFTLFQTVCLFVSAFIVNFLVLDGRSNYLEGALLCATYVIIALAAFFYPREDQVSQWG